MSHLTPPPYRRDSGVSIATGASVVTSASVSPGAAVGSSGNQGPSKSPSKELTPAEEVLQAVEAMREDGRHEAALGDAAGQNRNIVVSDAALALRDLIRSKPENAKLAVEAGGIEALVHALTNRPNSEAVQKAATVTLGYLVGFNAENRTLAGAKGGVEAVISSIRGHPNSVAVQELAIEALSKLVAKSHRDNQELARQAGGIEAVVPALAQHRGSEVLQHYASLVLSSLVENSQEGQLRAGRAGGLDAVIAALKAFPNSEAVQEHAALALVGLVERNSEHQAQASELGAITVVTDALKWHRRNTVVQVAALRALRELMVDHPDNQTLAGSAGLVPVVLSVLKGHLAHEVVQEHVCEALVQLVTNNQVNQKLAKEAGVIEAVVQVLGKHAGSQPVQAKGANALGHLVANNPENQRLAGEAMCIDVMVQGLQRHQNNEAVNENVAGALGFLVARMGENQVLARNAGAIDSVIRALRHFPNSAGVQLKASGALRKLIVGNYDNTNVAVETGGIEEVIRVLQQNPKSSETEHHQRKYQKRAREAGLIEAVVAKLRQRLKTPNKAKGILGTFTGGPSQATLLGAFADLVNGNYENQRVAAEATGVEVVVACLTSDPGSDSIQESGARALLGLVTDHAGNQRRAKRFDARKVLLDAQAAFPENRQVQESTREALEALHVGDTFAGRICDTDYGRRHAHYTAIPDTALRGVTLEQLLELQDFVQDTLQKHDLVDAPAGLQLGASSVIWEKLTMYQLRDHFILPLTRSSRCSFVESVAHGKQPPMWMVSHWWGTPFPFTVRMLQLQAQSRYLHGAPAVTYWCCTFANNQHNLCELDDGDVLKSPFARAMLSQSCMGTVLLCDPEVTPLLRTWCVFEAHLTQQLRCGKLLDRTDKKRYFLDILAPVELEEPKSEDKDKFTVTMLQDAVGGSWNEVSDMEGVFFPLGVAHVGVNLDVCKAEASVESDRAAIMNYLASGTASKDPPPDSHPKYLELNTFVHLVFASAELYRVACEQPENALEDASALIRLRADVNSFVRLGNTPLFAAAGADAHTAGAKTNATTQHSLMELLLNAKADVNHANAEMKTVLDCGSKLSEESLDLLLEHGAKTFADAAPELERNANAQLSQILATGFGTERQAFVGGDAGTKLTGAAQRSLQVVATAILKLYPWAPCRIGIQTDSGRHQAQLAGERAQSVKATLESAGCKNTFDTHHGSQRALVSLSVSLLPPTSPAPRAVKSSLLPANMPRRFSGIAPPDLLSPTSHRGLTQRSPQAVLALHAHQPRLPPVSVDLGLASQPLRSPAGHGSLRPNSGNPASQVTSSLSLSSRRQAISTSPLPGGHGGQAAGGSSSSRTLQASSSSHNLNTSSNLAAFDGSTSSRAPGSASGSRVLTHRTSMDLTAMAAMAGDRWRRTSVTVSLSSPALPQMPGSQRPNGANGRQVQPSLSSSATGNVGFGPNDKLVRARGRHNSTGSIINKSSQQDRAKAQGFHDRPDKTWTAVLPKSSPWLRPDAIVEAPPPVPEIPPQVQRLPSRPETSSGVLGMQRSNSRSQLSRPQTRSGLPGPALLSARSHQVFSVSDLTG